MNPVEQAEQLILKGGEVHLMGIGGIGVAGVAWLLMQSGFKVGGCDLLTNRQTDWLSRNGGTISLGHNRSHITSSIDWLIRSTAVSDSHPEILRARELGIPVSRRGEVLPALMRNRTCIAVSGTHGKTTTTAMIAQLLGCGYCVGGEVVGMDGVARDGEIMVVEADESDGTVAGYTPDYAVITNIEYDHMEHHASQDAFIGCFEQLIHNTRHKVFYRIDDPISQRLCSNNPKCEPFVYPAATLPVPLPGRYNQWNAAAAMSVSRLWKGDDELRATLKDLKPVRRRFETVYHADGIRIVTDYAHHPTEITALIQTAQELKPRRLLGVFQPHRYTRTLALGPDFPPSFEGLDELWLVPVYAASEKPLSGGTTNDLFARFPKKWKSRLHNSTTLQTAWADIHSQLQAGDLLLVIGAGDIEQLAEWAKVLAS